MDDVQRVIRAQDQLTTIVLPAEIDVAGSRRLCGELGSALACAAVIIVDMTARTYCHSSGVHILQLAQEQAAATGVELRLVVPSAGVLRTLAWAGVDWLLPIYPTLEDALAAETGG
jgi:anti-anti-sigma factor